jgi:hypothetical protein
MRKGSPSAAARSRRRSGTARAWEFDFREARGLDGALLELSQAPYGGILLGAVAVGLFAYALYCFVQARYRRI